MSYIQMDSSFVPVENQEITLLSSTARTTASTVDFNTLTARDILLIVDVTAIQAAVAEVASLTISAIPTVAGNVTVTLNGTANLVAIDPAIETTTALVAAKIRATAMTGWTLGGTGAVVTFTATTGGVRTDATYSAGSTGATGTMTTSTQGVDAAGLTPRLYGITPGGKEFLLGSPAKISAVGVYVYLYTPNGGTAHDGITGIYQTTTPRKLRFKGLVDNANSITYSTEVILSV